MADKTTRKFGFVTQVQPTPPPHHECGFHGSVSMSDWMKYINSYIDVRARQIYDKLKNQGVDSVTYVENSSMPDNTFQIGTLKVDSNTTPINVPNIDVKYATTDSFNNPTDFPILTLKLGDQNVEVYGEDPNGATLDSVLLRDTVTKKVYKVVMQNGELKSEEVKVEK